MTEKELESKATYIEDPLLYPYRIKMDQYQYALEKETRVRNKDHFRWTALGYYHRIDSCLVKLIDDSVKEKSYKSLKEYTENLLEKIKTLNNFTIK